MGEWCWIFGFEEVESNEMVRWSVGLRILEWEAVNMQSGAQCGCQ